MKIIRWRVQSIVISNHIDLNLERSRKGTDFNSQALILIPHADDELIGCYSLLRDHGNDVMGYYFGLTGGNIDCTNVLTRKEEICSVFKYYGKTLIHGHLNYSDDIASIIEERHIHNIFVPNIIDWHTEHLEVNSTLVNVLKRVDSEVSIWLYKTSTPLDISRISNVYQMSKRDVSDKWSLFRRYYRSQSNLPIERYECYERIYGKIYHCYACEPFIRLTRLQYLEYYESIDKAQLSKLERHVNNINYLWKVVNGQ